VIGLPAGVKVFLACGRTDMRKGMDGLAMQVQAVLQQDPFSGHVFCFRGRRGDLIKALYWDTQGLCLFAKRLEKGRFIWPSPADGVVRLTAAQLSMLAGRHRLAGAAADLAAGSGGLRRDRLTQGVWPR
jgi:transposase